MFKRMSDEEIMAQCSELGIKCKLYDDKAMLSTQMGEWYFNRNSKENIKLYHNNYCRATNRVSNANKFNNCYHKQKKTFSTQAAVINYIYKHDRLDKKIKESKMERLFNKVEQSKKR